MANVAIDISSAAGAVGHFSMPVAAGARYGHPRNRRRVQGWAIAIGGTTVLWAGIISGAIAMAHLFA